MSGATVGILKGKAASHEAAESPQARARASLGTWLLGAAIALLPLAFCLAFVNEPFERDEGAYATVAQGLLRGELPYRDLFDHKPPLAFVWYALSFVAFGEHVESPRIAGAISMSVTGLLVIAVGRALYSTRAGMVAGVAFSLATSFAMLRPGFNTETFMLPWMTASFWAFAVARKRQSLAWYAACGGLGTVALLTKSVAIFNLAVFGGILLADALREGNGPRSWAPLAMVGAGSLGLAGLVLAPFVLAGATGDLVYANIYYNALYAGELPFARSIQARVFGTAVFVQASGPLIVAALLGATSSRRPAPGQAVAAAWCGASIVGVLVTGHFALHYYQQLLPSLALLTAPLAHGLRSPRRPVLLAAGLAFAAAAFVSVGMNGRLFATTSHIERLAMKEGDVQIAENAVADEAIGAYVRAHTGPDDTIFNFGRESQVYFHAGRRSAVRFFYDRPFVLDPPTLDETIRALKKRPPAMIIETGTGLAEPPAQYLSFREEGYREAAQIGSARIYERSR